MNLYRNTVRVPTAYELSCGAYYRRNIDGTILRMYREHGVYIVSANDRGAGYYTYAEAKAKLYTYIASIGG